MKLLGNFSLLLNSYELKRNNIKDNRYSYHFNRIEYDAYRTDLEALAQAAKTDANSASRMEEAQASYEQHKQNFEKLRSDVSIKLKFLDENRVCTVFMNFCFFHVEIDVTCIIIVFLLSILFQIKVMHKQLLLFHNAVSAYFSGNQTALEATLKQFNIKVKSPNSSLPSWLEQ